jgi:hypothetical protein
MKALKELRIVFIISDDGCNGCIFNGEDRCNFPDKSLVIWKNSCGPDFSDNPGAIGIFKESLTSKLERL